MRCSGSLFHIIPCAFEHAVHDAESQAFLLKRSYEYKVISLPVEFSQICEKIMGRSEFKGVSPVDPYCGKDYLKY